MEAIWEQLSAMLLQWLGGSYRIDPPYSHPSAYVGQLEYPSEDQRNSSYVPPVVLACCDRRGYLYARETNQVHSYGGWTSADGRRQFPTNHCYIEYFTKNLDYADCMQYFTYDGKLHMDEEPINR